MQAPANVGNLIGYTGGTRRPLEAPSAAAEPPGRLGRSPSFQGDGSPAAQPVRASAR
jgi:hypothetical protein